MELKFVNPGVYLTVTLFTLSGVFYANTIKNNIANTIKAELDQGKVLNLNNFETIKKEVGIITKAEIYVRILLCTFASQSIVCISAAVYSLMNNLSNCFACCEITFITLWIIGIVIFLTIIITVICSPRQNLLSSKWSIPKE